jgi:hypothetical protein
MEFKQIIQNALDLLKKQLELFLETKLRDCYGDEFFIYMENGPKVNPNTMIDINLYNSKTKYKDVLYYLNAFIKNWEFPFKNQFNHNYCLTLCHSIKYFRNRWAHQSTFTIRETYRLIDECQALLEELKMDYREIELIRRQVMEMLYEEEKKSVKDNSFNLIGNTSNSSNNNFGNSNWPSNNVNPNIQFNTNNQSRFDCDQDELMIDVDDINNKDLLDEIKYQKLIYEQIQDKNNPYKITLYNESNK